MPTRVPVDEHAPPLEYVNHEHRRPRGILETHKLDIAIDTAIEPARELSHAGCARVSESYHEVNVRALGRRTGSL